MGSANSSFGVYHPGQLLWAKWGNVASFSPIKKYIGSMLPAYFWLRIVLSLNCFSTDNSVGECLNMLGEEETVISSLAR